MILTIDESKASCLESPNNLKHEKYTFNRLTSTTFNGKSYYSIVYEKDGEEHEGYSSYSLDVISDFLKEYFLQPKQPDSGDDLISRHVAIDVVKRLMGDCELSRTVQTGLHILSSPQPEQKPGRWIRVSADKYVRTSDYIYRCSECGNDTVGKPKYCTDCGAKMRGEQ